MIRRPREGRSRGRSQVGGIEPGETPEQPARPNRNRGEHHVGDSRPDEILAGERGGLAPLFKELGHYAARLSSAGTRQRHSLPTASLWRTDQGPTQRIDCLYATPQIAEALLRVDVDAGDEVREASDHALLMATFSLHRLRRALSTQTERAA